MRDYADDDSGLASALVLVDKILKESGATQEQVSALVTAYPVESGTEEKQELAVLRFELPAPLARYLVSKRSVTVDGTSLTVVDVVDATADQPAWFSVSLIPTTLADTTLGALTPGDRVNLEVDILAKHLERLTIAREGDTHE